MTAIALHRSAISQRTYRRRGLVAYGLIMILLALSLLGNWLSSKVFLPIESVKVVGDLKQLRPEQISMAVAGVIGSGFFSVDVQQVKSQIEALPWAHSVSVRRVWPHSLALFIEERHAVAVWNDDAYVSEQGVMFKPDRFDILLPIPVLKGPADKYLVVYEQYRLMQTALDAANLKIVASTVDDRLAIELKLDNGIRILVGRKLDSIDLETELERFVYACHNGLAERLHRVELVDLRYTNGFSIKWKT